MRTLLCVFLLISSVGYCSDLEIVESKVFLTKSEERELAPQTEQETTRRKRTFYTYRVVFNLKNISDKELDVATRGLSIMYVKGNKEGKKEGKNEMCVGISHRRINEMIVVPPAVDFAMVNLKPGECAMVRFKQTFMSSGEKVTIVYNPSDPYEGRFGYWTGTVKSVAVKIKDVRGKWVEWNVQNSHWLQPGY